MFITGNSGFPKATQISSQLDRIAGVEPRVIGSKKQTGAKFKLTQELIDNGGFNDPDRDTYDLTESATPLAQAWAGHRYGLQALKPSFEFIAVAQKPYRGRPVDCITQTGAGALNIAKGRIETQEQLVRPAIERNDNSVYGTGLGTGVQDEPSGRWPSNFALVHDYACTDDICTESCAVRRLGEQTQDMRASKPSRTGTAVKEGRSWFGSFCEITTRYDDVDGNAARFFHNSDWMYERLEHADPVRYEAKASTSEREAGLDDFDYTTVDDGRRKSIDNAYQRGETERKNTNPCVKPLSLNKWLASLLLPPDLYAPRRLLVPFAGSGSEAIGALLAGFEHITGIEGEAEYVAIARARIAWWQRQQRRLQTNDPETILERARVISEAQIGLFE